MWEKKKVIYACATTFIVSAFVFYGVGMLCAKGFFNIGHGEFYINTSKMNMIKNLIDENYLGEYDPKALSEGAIAGMVDAVGDKYTRYYTEEEYSSKSDKMKGEYFGVGIGVGANISDNKLYVLSTYEDSPARKAGINPGDVIFAVNGEDVNASMLDEVVEKLKGHESGEDKNEEITLTLNRASEDGENSNSSNNVYGVSLTRAKINTSIVKGHMISSDSGYVRISGFDGKTSSGFANIIKKLEDQGAKKLVIDLRGNPGGNFTAVAEIADQILPECIITYVENKKGEKKYTYSDIESLDMEIAVLIDGNSASASEILAISLQENGKAVLVGEQSFGKGIVQSVVPLNDGTGISITIEKYFSPKGNSIHGIGIVPDIKVSLSEEAKQQIGDLPYEKDAQLQKAFEALDKPKDANQ